MPEATDVTDHGGGVWSIPVPIPDNPLGHTLVHLLDTDRGPVLVDTGWDDPASWDTLAAGLAACGTGVAEIHGVLVTHHHPDHHGLSGQVREASGAWIAMHARRRRTSYAAPARPSPTLWLDYLADKLAAAGAPEDHLAPLRAARAAGRPTCPGQRAALPDREIVPGELLDLPGRRLRAIWTPGHTPGHVCLHLEEAHPAAAPRPRPALLRRPSPPRDHPAHRPVRGPGRRHRHRPPRRLPRLPGARRPPRPRRGPPRPPARFHRRPRPRPRAARPPRGPPRRPAAPSSPPRSPPGSSPSAWSGTAPGPDIPYGSRNIAVSEAEAHLRRLVKLGRAEAVPGTDPVTYQAR